MKFASERSQNASGPKRSMRRSTTAEGPVDNVNELEWVEGEIYANIWQTDRIARISPTPATSSAGSTQRPAQPHVSQRHRRRPQRHRLGRGPTSASSSPANSGPTSSRSNSSRSRRASASGLVGRAFQPADRLSRRSSRLKGGSQARLPAPPALQPRNSSSARGLNGQVVTIVQHEQ